MWREGERVCVKGGGREKEEECPYDILVSPLSARLYTSPDCPALCRCHSARQTSLTCTVFILRSFDHSS